MRRAFTLAMLVLAASGAAQAQQTLPASDALAREMARIDQERQSLFDAAAAAATDAPRAPNAFPNLPAAPTPTAPTPQDIDIAALAQRYARGQPALRTDEAMVFASFTMPPAAWQRLVTDAAKIGAPVVVRGFKDNSLAATTAAIRSQGLRDGALVIHPEAFKKYRITRVPALVLVNATAATELDASGCALPDAYVRVSGDVTLDFALETIIERAPAFAPTATRLLRQLRRRP